jgi:hypothetical protein
VKQLKFTCQVLEIGMNFLSADDMDARMAVQLRKRLGFGITTNMHITGMHVEGKVCIISLILVQVVCWTSFLFSHHCVLSVTHTSKCSLELSTDMAQSSRMLFKK